MKNTMQGNTEQIIIKYGYPITKDMLYNSRFFSLNIIIGYKTLLIT